LFAGSADCVRCHRGADLTDNLAHDVGTGFGFAERESASVFATPPLKGLAHSGPYLHDGSASSLRAVVEQTVLTNKMGKGSHLSAADVDDLVAFLERL
jgi:cytochrome c peroxidase